VKIDRNDVGGVWGGGAAAEVADGVRGDDADDGAGPGRRLSERAAVDRGGDILSIYPLDEDWERLKKSTGGDLRWRRVGLPCSRPRRCWSGSAAGTSGAHAPEVRAVARVTVIERDPVILRVACDWFGLRRLDGAGVPVRRMRTADRAVAHAGCRRFDFVMEDAGVRGATRGRPAAGGGAGAAGGAGWPAGDQPAPARRRASRSPPRCGRAPRDPRAPRAGGTARTC